MVSDPPSVRNNFRTGWFYLKKEILAALQLELNISFTLESNNQDLIEKKSE